MSLLKFIDTVYSFYSIRLSQECEILIVVVRLQGSREIHWGTDVDDWRQNSQSAFELRKALEAWLTFLLCHTGYGNTDDEEKEGEKRKLLQLVSNYFFEVYS